MLYQSFNIRRSARFYYDRLNDDQRRAYNALKKCIEEYGRSTKVSVSKGCSVDDFDRIGFFVMLDNPLLYYLDYTSCSMYRMADHNELSIGCHYSYSKIEVENNLLRITEKVEDIYYTLFRSLKDDYEKEKRFHDYLIENVFYHLKPVEKRKNEFNVIGPLFSGYGVCMGFAQVVNLVMNSVGVKCTTICGDSKNTEDDTGHAWNLIRIDKNYYHLDVTWDYVDVRGSLRYDYFNLTDDMCRKDHTWDTETGCLSDKDNYHVRNNLCARSVSDVHRIIRDTDGSLISVRFMSDRMTPEKALRSVVANCRYRFNSDQRVLTIEMV